MKSKKTESKSDPIKLKTLTLIPVGKERTIPDIMYVEQDDQLFPRKVDSRLTLTKS